MCLSRLVHVHEQAAECDFASPLLVYVLLWFGGDISVVIRLKNCDFSEGWTILENLVRRLESEYVPFVRSRVIPDHGR